MKVDDSVTLGENQNRRSSLMKFFFLRPLDNHLSHHHGSGNGKGPFILLSPRNANYSPINN